MVIVRRWIVVSLHRRKWDMSSGGDNVEDLRGVPWAGKQARLLRGGPMKIIKESHDGGTQ
ncbi:hypothetical protein DPMN_010023 [Dreissena polymorpha]|uniref:Uncharacterized protein n=1 Tax=Dreissena polymorpha TaxID=45954 RepID=A0A9D4S151_DREPO|nr:hypothetical protein DPMN_010023 [Dreissena polymorpha]